MNAPRLITVGGWPELSLIDTLQEGVHVKGVQVAAPGRTWGKVFPVSGDATRDCEMMNVLMCAARQLIVDEPWVIHPTYDCQVCMGQHNHEWPCEPTA